MIAMALASEPALLILDEPTTALDATVEAEVLDLVSSLRQRFQTSVLFISHNLAVIAKMCDRVGVMYAGEIVEQGPAREVFDNPRHPYTVGLLRCVPRGGQRKDHGRLDTIPGFLPGPGEVPVGCIFAKRCALADQRCLEETPPMYDVAPGRTARCHYHERAPELPRATPEDVQLRRPDSAEEPVIRLRGVSKTFHVRGEHVRAVVGVDLDLKAGETLGLVGESGSGKTTLARTARPQHARRRIAHRAGRLTARSRVHKTRPQAAAGNADHLPEPGLRLEPAPQRAPHRHEGSQEAGGPLRAGL